MVQLYYIRIYYKHSKSAALAAGAQDDNNEESRLLGSSSSPFEMKTWRPVFSASAEAAIPLLSPGVASNSSSSGQPKEKSNRFTSLYHWLTSAPTAVGVLLSPTFHFVSRLSLVVT